VWYLLSRSVAQIAFPMACLGCGQALKVEPKPHSNNDSVVSKDFVLSLDAGVVFSDTSTYLCLPTARLKILAKDRIVELKSSCECVVPTVERYISADGETLSGIRLDFIPDSTKSKALVRSPLLSVMVTGKLESGQALRFSVTFLHASRSEDLP
jgi:hypothetical protein